MSGNAIESQQEKYQHNPRSDEQEPAIFFQHGFRLVLWWHKGGICICSRRRTACRGWLRFFLQYLCAAESVLINSFHCVPPWLLGVNGTGSKMGRSTCSASANCSCSFSVDSLKLGRSNTITPSARW